MKQCGEIGRFCEMTGQVGRDIADDPFFPVFLLKMILNTDFRKHLQDQRIQYVRRARSMELVQTLKHTVERRSNGAVRLNPVCPGGKYAFQKA